MNKSVWIFQYPEDLRRKGPDGASWFVGWYDLAGKRRSESCGPGARGKNLAEKRKRRIEGELDLGVHAPVSKKSWADFRTEYQEQILSRLEPSSQIAIQVALDAFERHAKPGKVEAITTQTVDLFVSRRRNDKGKKPGSKVSPATINKDLRHVKAALKKAHEWGYLRSLPRIRMVREPEKLPRYVTPEHFELLYTRAAEKAKYPNQPGQSFTAPQYWRALMVTAYMTGLRINEILSFKREDLDFERGQLITRASDNKGKRDEVLALHKTVLEHLQSLNSIHARPLAWPHDSRLLWTEFGRIQREAGIHLICPGEHKHTKACHVYGFHDFRRAFATVNAPRLKAETLQKLMRHRSYKTTLGYINLASQVDDAVANMPVPPVLRKPLAPPSTQTPVG